MRTGVDTLLCSGDCHRKAILFHRTVEVIDEEQAAKVDVIVGISHVPFEDGDEREFARRLCRELETCGHRAEILDLPFFDHRDRGRLLDDLLAGRLLGLGSSSDAAGERYIALEASAALLRHPRKVVWLASLDSSRRDDGSGEGVDDDASLLETRAAVLARSVGEARRVFARSLSAAVQLRVRANVDAQVLYPPGGALATTTPDEDFVVVPIVGCCTHRCQIDSLLNALNCCRDLRLRFVDVDGTGFGEAVAVVQRRRVGRRCEWKAATGVEELREAMAGARAMVIIGRDEPRPDVPLVALRMGLPLIAAVDSGAAAELVHHGETGWLVDGEGDGLEDAFAAVGRGGAAFESMHTAAHRLYSRTVRPWPDTIAQLLAS